jgi:FdhD protein
VKKEGKAGIEEGRVIRRGKDGSLQFHHDDLAMEEPLEMRVRGKAIATTMRTPGHDGELAVGFLVAEGIIRKRDQVRHLTKQKSELDGSDNIIDIDLAAGVKIQPSSLQRAGTISTSCGVCGKTSIAALQQMFPAIESNRNVRMDIQGLLSLPAILEKEQSNFRRTGGIHAAGIFDVAGNLQVVREDVGRHNAVDKAIGRLFLDGAWPLNRHVLFVSGRVSFEIMQKALAAGIPIVAAVSAPSTLAVDFARANNQTLAGFVRPPTCNIYTHVERIILEKSE